MEEAANSQLIKERVDGPLSGSFSILEEIFGAGYLFTATKRVLDIALAGTGLCLSLPAWITFRGKWEHGGSKF